MILLMETTECNNVFHTPTFDIWDMFRVFHPDCQGAKRDAQTFVHHPQVTAGDCHEGAVSRPKGRPSLPCSRCRCYLRCDLSDPDPWSTGPIRPHSYCHYWVVGMCRICAIRRPPRQSYFHFHLTWDVLPRNAWMHLPPPFRLAVFVWHLSPSPGVAGYTMLVS